MQPFSMILQNIWIRTHFERLSNKEQIDRRLLSFHHELWHGPVGAMIARKEFGVTDEDMLNAIRFHTTGRAGMSPLEKLIYIADMIEPGRDFPGVETLRELAEENIRFGDGSLHSSVGAVSCFKKSTGFSGLN